MTTKEYIAKYEEKFLNDLGNLIRIQSISSHSDKKEEINKCANEWVRLLTEAGFDHADVMESKGNPVVFASKTIDPKLPTIMVYGHYDVMPADPWDEWESDPFEPDIRKGKLYARGADDDKGQSILHLKAFDYLVKTDQLKCNVKFIIEGEEEIGSPSLEDFCTKHKELLKCDTILVSDTSMLGADMPSITTGLRGLAYWEIEVSSANRDLHSGIFGGAVANPINELAKILAQLVDNDGRIAVPGFYDDVAEISLEEKELIDQIPLDIEAYKTDLGIKHLYGEKGYSTIERTGVRPTLDLCGIWGGYTGEGSKTVLPAKAYAKLSARLVPNQEYEKIRKLVEDHLKKTTPKHVDIKVSWLHGAHSYVCPIDSPEYKAAERAYENVFGKRPLPVRSGGSIGVIPVFEKTLGVKPILMGFGLGSNAIHSPNEHFHIDLYRKGIETIVEFYKEYCNNI